MYRRERGTFSYGTSLANWLVKAINVSHAALFATHLQALLSYDTCCQCLTWNKPRRDLLCPTSSHRRGHVVSFVATTILSITAIATISSYLSSWPSFLLHAISLPLLTISVVPFALLYRLYQSGQFQTFQYSYHELPEAIYEGFLPVNLLLWLLTATMRLLALSQTAGL